MAGEPLGPPEVYGNDRIFAYITTLDGQNPEIDAKVKALEDAGHPVVRHMMRDSLSLGREFFLWEVATALAGALIGINSFDQPNVQESKDNTKALLDVYKKQGKLPDQELLWEGNGMKIYCDAQTRTQLKPMATSLESSIQAHLGRVKAGDYVAFTAYIQETSANDRSLEAIRSEVRKKFKVATTVGYGPRFLHSTGQLHKGGSDAGVFIQITAEETNDLAIPGEPFSFGVLKQAQALGDFQSLANRHRRAIRLHVGKDIAAGLKALLAAVK